MTDRDKRTQHIKWGGGARVSPVGRSPELTVGVSDEGSIALFGDPRRQGSLTPLVVCTTTGRASIIYDK